MHTTFGPLTRRFCLRVSGPDSLDFLEKLVTQSLSGLEIGALAYGALLSPQGKISADFFIWRTGEGMLLDCDETRLEDLQQRLRRFRLRAAVEIEACPDLAVAIYEGAPPAGALWAGPDPRRPEWGHRAIVPRSDAPALCPEETLLRARVAAGVPDLAQDAGPEEVFALEGLLEELNGVSFKKGCFPGQENVSRMKRRATTRKKFCRLRFAESVPEAGALITAGSAELGSIRAVGHCAALGLLRLDRALAAQEPLLAGGLPCRLDPPAWLILPAISEGEETSHA